jgi:cobalt/nickel transport system permease protein
MSHIHLPDGILPVWLWLSGYVLSALLIAILWRWGKATAEPRRFALLGIFAAIMILVMMIEVPPFSYHFNLSVVTGIILGPQLSVLAALIVNVVLALIGHGGITVIGLNSFILSAEMIVGHYAFRLISRLHIDQSKSGFVATVIGLASGTGLGYGIIVIASPHIDRILRSAALRPGVELGPGIEGPFLNLTRLAIIMFGVGAIGWVAEGLLTGAILSYLAKVYPDLISRRNME